MTKCLEEVSARNLQTVAFPAIGTGGLGYPKDLVAKQMYNIVSQFAGNNPKSSLKKVYFVVHYKSEDIYKVLILYIITPFDIVVSTLQRHYILMMNDI